MGARDPREDQRAGSPRGAALPGCLCRDSSRQEHGTLITTCITVTRRCGAENSFRRSSGDDREGWTDDTKLEERRHDGAASCPASSTNEPASETLLTPLRAHYHKYMVESPWLRWQCTFGASLGGIYAWPSSGGPPSALKTSIAS